MWESDHFDSFFFVFLIEFYASHFVFSTYLSVYSWFWIVLLRSSRWNKTDCRFWEWESKFRVWTDSRYDWVGTREQNLRLSWSVSPAKVKGIFSTSRKNIFCVWFWSHHSFLRIWLVIGDLFSGSKSSPNNLQRSRFLIAEWKSPIFISDALFTN